MVLILFGILFSHSLWADEAILGEKNLDHYYGPTHPILINDFYKFTSQFDDQNFSNIYMKNKIQSEIFALDDFFQGEMYLGISCPDFEYFKIKEDIHYYLRLIALSYLRQSLMKVQASHLKLGDSYNCMTQNKKLLKQCRPKSKAMQNFVKDAIKLIPKEEKIIIPFEEARKTSVQKWLNGIQGEYPKYLTQKLLQKDCSNLNCSNKTYAKKKLRNICQTIKEDFVSICSENDKYYGLSNSPELFYILTSETNQLSENNSFFNGCLKRYIESHENKEIKKQYFSTIFKYLLQENIQQGNLSGRLFKIGELNEFYKAGVENVFENEKKEEKKLRPKVKIAKTTPKFEKIELPKIKKTKKKKVVKKIVAKQQKKKIEKKSAFYIAALFREKLNSEAVDVDMRRFKYDYIFGLEFIEKFEKIIMKFSSIKSLKDMKKYDKLGSLKAPVPLRFIKFLIDREKHQNLFNIIQVLGNTFYVENDIDKKHTSMELVRIENSRKSGAWELKILREN